MSKPFRVEIDLGGSVPVTFDLTEEQVRSKAKINPRLGGLLGDGDGRQGVRSAAFQMCLDMLDVSRDPGSPVTITDDTGVGIIPLTSIRRIRLDDPETGSNRRPFGFAAPDV